MQHPNIVKYYRSHFVRDNVWVVMEYVRGGTLSQAVLRHEFKESEIAYVAKEMLRALKYLHSHKLIHRDLKSGNVMLTSKGAVKLIDFGLCVDHETGPFVNMAGSPFWMPPEMIKSEPHSYPADIWSFAICILELANKQPPHRKSSVRAMFVAATGGFIGLDAPQKWSPLFPNFLELCFQCDPQKRATVADLLSHSWLSCADTKERMRVVIKEIFEE